MSFIREEKNGQDGIYSTLEAWEKGRFLEAVGDCQETMQWREKFSQ